MFNSLTGTSGKFQQEPQRQDISAGWLQFYRTLSAQIAATQVDGKRATPPLAEGRVGFRLRSETVSQPVADAITAQATFAKSLQQNWDGYGAHPIDEATVDKIVSHVRQALSGMESLPPDLIPGGDGSMQAEWHLRNVQLTYNVGRDGEVFLWFKDRATGEETEFYDRDAFRALFKFAPMLA